MQFSSSMPVLLPNGFQFTALNGVPVAPNSSTPSTIPNLDFTRSSTISGSQGAALLNGNLPVSSLNLNTLLGHPTSPKDGGSVQAPPPMAGIAGVPPDPESYSRLLVLSADFLNWSKAVALQSTSGTFSTIAGQLLSKMIPNNWVANAKISLTLVDGQVVEFPANLAESSITNHAALAQSLAAFSSQTASINACVTSGALTAAAAMLSTPAMSNVVQVNGTKLSPVVVASPSPLAAHSSARIPVPSSRRKQYRPNRIPSPGADLSERRHNLSGDSGALDLSRGANTNSTPVSPDDKPAGSLFSPLTNRAQMSANRVSDKLRLPFPKRRRRLISAIRHASVQNRSFTCNVCLAPFPSLNTLDSHTRKIHENYRCHVCDNSFTQRSNLQRHALAHLDFRPVECLLCNKAYNRKDHLMRHMEMAHPLVSPLENIKVYLTSSECLDYLIEKAKKEAGCANGDSLTPSQDSPTGNDADRLSSSNGPSTPVARDEVNEREVGMTPSPVVEADLATVAEEESADVDMVDTSS